MGAAGLPTQPSSQYIATCSEIKILIMTLCFGQCPFCIHKTSTVVLYTLIHFLNFVNNYFMNIGYIVSLMV